jgi:PleD family two-component response regulator
VETFLYQATGEGSIFTIKVEYKEGNIDDIEKLENKKIISIANHDKKYKILVVDDKVENLKVTVNLLNVVGFETVEAVDGKDAIEKLSNNRPDLILMDMRMPVMDGYEAIND